MDVSKLIPIILTEQFNRVGEEYAEKKTSHAEWYQDYTWTEEQQEEFIVWLTEFLGKKLRISKKRATREAQMWNLNYGWKTKEQQ